MVTNGYEPQLPHLH